jgi:hypothetical protein
MAFVFAYVLNFCFPVNVLVFGNLYLEAVERDRENGASLLRM